MSYTGRFKKRFKILILVRPYSLFAHFRCSDIYDIALVALIRNDFFNHLSNLGTIFQINDAVVVEGNSH